MKNTFLSLVALTMTVSMNYGQTTGQFRNNSVGTGGFSDEALSYSVGDLQGAKEKFNLEDGSIQGSPYEDNSFKFTTLYYDGEEVQKLFYRYNAYNEEIEIKQQNLEVEPIRSLGKDKKIAVRMDDKNLSFKTFIDKDNNTLNGYLLTLEEGDDYVLYKRINVKYTEPQAAQNSFVPAVPAKFSHFIEYYLEMKGQNRIDEIQLRNNKLLKLLPKTEKENLALYLKENKLNIKEEKDLIQAFMFLNS